MVDQDTLDAVDATLKAAYDNQNSDEFRKKMLKVYGTAPCGWHHISCSIIISRSYMRCKMHMYEYNESNTRYTKTQRRTKH